MLKGADGADNEPSAHFKGPLEEAAVAQLSAKGRLWRFADIPSKLSCVLTRKFRQMPANSRKCAALRCMGKVRVGLSQPIPEPQALIQFDKFFGLSMRFAPQRLP